MNEESFPLVYPHNVRNQIEKLTDVYLAPQTSQSVSEDPALLRNAEVIFSGWGGPNLNEEFLQAAPDLKAFFYAAGSMKGIVTDACWQRNITFTSAYAANAVPVAEYTLSQILFSLKYGWHSALSIKQTKLFKKPPLPPAPGALGSTIGIISLGMVGRRVCKLLENFQVKVIAYDPFISERQASSLNVELCSLEDIFRLSDVVSLHTPWLKETEGMITGAHFEMMKPYATFINTARGAVVRENELIEVLKRRSDMIAILDVTYPEPPVSDSQLYSLPNVILTPHIAGSQGNECGRMGAYMLEELERYLEGRPLKWQVTKNNFSLMA
ncbi:hydroxyacid dehydrogenase [Alicyclobacillus fastidiosus]|uniref:Hydroxyacid dehydrogenase n=1 Tax=Alicyclobacillus fastidiosus TaxID=392011 RepID=A0ABY6ZQA4_9BACL|nr:hydroxyacid dehydrogenase [Alicyclobacillus fastidiosus]WAH44632.1 hydroxyacid dehydrogenase [Alicyclobacillus fastidiosus]